VTTEQRDFDLNYLFFRKVSDELLFYLFFFSKIL